MAVTQSLALLAIKPVLGGVGAAIGIKLDEAGQGVTSFLSERFADKSLKIPQILEQCISRAWRTLEIALAGESLLSRFDKADERAFREQIRLFLERSPLALPSAEFRKLALKELVAARSAGLLLGGGLDALELARRAGPLARFANSATLVEDEMAVLADLANEFRSLHYPTLAQLISLKRTSVEGQTISDEPLLVTAVRFYFRRAVEADQALSRALTYAKLERLDESQEASFSALSDALQSHSDRIEASLNDLAVMSRATLETVTQTRADVLDIKAEQSKLSEAIRELSASVLEMLQTRQLERRTLRPTDSLAIRDESERRQIQQLVQQFRALPAEERTKAPALLNGLGKLQVVAGDFASAQQNFAEVASLVAEATSRAEAQHNLYRSALDLGDFEQALVGLCEASRLDPGRFAPFPMDKYEPLKILGAGGFGIAILARNRLSQGKVVIKSLRTEGLDRGVNDIIREASAMEEVEHPAVIRLRDCAFVDAGQTRPYLVMDYFEGKTLADFVKENGPITVDAFGDLARQVVGGLEAAHARGIWHRDVKPANILVRQEGSGWRVKIIDFGLAMRHDLQGNTTRTANTRSISGTELAGTLDYAAPEQIGRLPGVKVGPYSDVYGFGKTACYALFATASPLNKHWRTLPQPLVDLLDECLAETPSERPQTMTTVRERLEQALAGSVSKPTSEPQPSAPSFSPIAPMTPLTPLAPLAPMAPIKPLKPPTENRSDVFGQVGKLEGHAGSVSAVAFTSDGRRLVSGGHDRTVRTWDLSTQREERTFPGHKGPVFSVAVSPDARRILSGSGDQTARLWDIETGVLLKDFPQQTNRTVCFSPDGRRALCGNLFDGKMRLWDLQTGTEIKRLTGHTDWVLSVAFTPDGTRGISASMDRTVRLWDLSTGRQLRCFSMHGDTVCSVAFSPDGQLVLSGGADRIVRIWDARSGQELFRLVGHAGQVNSIAVTPDGLRVVSGSQDGTVRIWDMLRGRQLACLTGHVGEVNSVAVSPDGLLLASAGVDGIIYLWSLVG